MEKAQLKSKLKVMMMHDYDSKNIKQDLNNLTSFNLYTPVLAPSCINSCVVCFCACACPKTVYLYYKKGLCILYIEAR